MARNPARDSGAAQPFVACAGAALGTAFMAPIARGPPIRTSWPSFAELAFADLLDRQIGDDGGIFGAQGAARLGHRFGGSPLARLKVSKAIVIARFGHSVFLSKGLPAAGIFAYLPPLYKVTASRARPPWT